MKKRILALILCVATLAACLVSCGETDYDKSKKYTEEHGLTPEKEYVTLNLYLPSTGEIEKETVRDMELAFNKIVEPLYRTRVAFHLIDEATYAEQVQAQAALAASNREQGIVDDTTPLRGENYPREGASQFDIFVTLDRSMFDTMRGEGYVTDLTTELTSAYSIILNDKTHPEDSVPAIIYDNATLPVTSTDAEGATTTKNTYFGVPAGFLIGTYTYEVYEKDFFTKYYTSGTADPETKILSETTYAEVYAQLSNKSGYEGHHAQVTGDYAKRFAIGELAESKGWGDYVILVNDANMPILNQDEIFKGMFCISPFCENKDRALEIIAALYTNKKLHTTLQYGAEGKTYRLNTDVKGDPVSVSPIAGAPYYCVDTRYTGNIYTLYPSTDTTFGPDADYLRYAFLQNADAKY